MSKQTGMKGLKLEEILRSYFLRAGFFVVRGVPVAYDKEDLTDVDLWLYEKPMGATRRIEIVDIKARVKPKAVERLFWTKGLVDVLDVDGAYVATPDDRPVLNRIAAKLKLVLITGTDLRRISESPSVRFLDRLTDEDLGRGLVEIDRQRKDKYYSNIRKHILATLADGLGPGSLVRCLELFSELAQRAAQAFPSSDESIIAGRLTYLSASLACIALDYISTQAVFRSIEERRALLLNAVKLGEAGSQHGERIFSLAMQIIERYVAGGANTARQVQKHIREDLDRIPADIIADQASNMLKDGMLFTIARELENSSYLQHCPSFDLLSVPTKSMLGACLDYAGISRPQFAAAWESQKSSPNATSTEKTKR
jgi:hypothetical protein